MTGILTTEKDHRGVLFPCHLAQTFRYRTRWCIATYNFMSKIRTWTQVCYLYM